ncbi:MAG: CPBP family glutamic-type intramembrane protease, partial [Myxococcota bacterium]
DFTGRAQLHFHVALVAVPALFVCVPLVLGLAIYNTFSSDGHPRHRDWTRRLWAVAIFDLLAVGALAAFAQPLGILNQTGLGGAEEIGIVRRARIGVGLDGTFEGEGARIASVRAGSPAEQGDLRAGDIVVRVDDAPIVDTDALQLAVGGGEPGVTRRLVVQRESSLVELQVVPEPMDAGGTTRSLFAVSPTESCTPPIDQTQVFEALIPLLLIPVLWIVFARRGGGGLRIWPPFVLILMLSLLVAPVGMAALLCSFRGGSSAGDMLLAVHAQVLVMFGLGVLWFRLVDRGDLLHWESERLLREGRTYVLGLIYLVGALGRIMPVILVLDLLFAGDGASQSLDGGPVEDMIGTTLTGGGAIGFTLLFLAVAVVGPVAEEVVFRGVLLPWMGRYVSPAWAIGLSSVLFAVLHSHYGLRMLGIFAIGAALGWARYRTGGLKIPILLHMTVNSVSSLSVFQ